LLKDQKVSLNLSHSFLNELFTIMILYTTDLNINDK